MADESVISSSVDISKLKVPDLKKELKSRGLSTTGNKNELVERLQGALDSKKRSSSVDDFEEDLLNEDDDDVHMVTAESVISDIDDAALNETLSQPTTPPKKRKVIDDTTPPPKKVVLNRNTPQIEIDTTRLSTESKEENKTSEEKKVIKLSSVSAKERLEMRAKKFDVSISTDARKVARAERFGTTTTTAATITTSNNNDGIKTKVNTSVDVLKQRAERFGGSVSKVLSNFDNQEKLEKRKARFGIVTDTDKAKQRLERFKQPVN